MCNDPWFKVFHNKNRQIKVPIRCGGCLGCRLDDQALWSARCNSEFIKYNSAFVTFTYDDLHLKYMDNALFPTLRRDDLHKYIDNIRHQIKNIPDNLMPQNNIKDFRFFACGEYGDLFKRPHFHVLFFGLDYQKFEKFFKNSWKNGSIKSLPITNGGIRYVVDYMTKNVSGELAENLYDNKGLERPFYSCSKGLGSDFFIAHKEEINNTGCVKIGSRIVPIPTYYKNKICDFSSESYRSRKNYQLESYNKVMIEAKKSGFDNYDDYVNFVRINKELSFHKKHVNNGKPSVRNMSTSTFYKKFDDLLLLKTLDIA